jgi:hypothetical protein
MAKPQKERLMGLFGKKDKTDTSAGGRARLTDPAMLRSKGILARAQILEIESKPSVGGTMADPAYHCTLKLEVRLPDEAPYEAHVQQRLPRSILGLLAGDRVVAAAWVDPKDHSRVAVDAAAGPIETAPAD